MIDAHIIDATALETLKQERICRWLESKGWELKCTLEDGRRILDEVYWEDTVIIPKDPKADQIAHILQAASRFYGISQLDIFVEMGGDLGKS